MTGKSDLGSGNDRSKKAGATGQEKSEWLKGEGAAECLGNKRLHIRVAKQGKGDQGIRQGRSFGSNNEGATGWIRQVRSRQERAKQAGTKQIGTEQAGTKQAGGT